MLFTGRKSKDWVETYGSLVLGAKAEPIAGVTEEHRRLAERMIALVQSLDGIGIAAPQAGAAVRMVVFNLPDARRPNPDSPGELLFIPMMPLAVVNPEIIAASEETTEAEEGCLSVPDVWAPVVRPARVVFRGWTLDGEKLEFECAGLLARLVQHELDHLDGVCFIDRLSPEARRAADRDINRMMRHSGKNNYKRSVIV